MLYLSIDYVVRKTMLQCTVHFVPVHNKQSPYLVDPGIHISIAQFIY